MLLCEALGAEAYRRRVKIYATDLDEEELAEARLALYTPKQLADVPEDLRERYFQPFNHVLVFRNDARRAVVFGKNDLLHDAPISRVDLLVSRNTLMYFAPSAQERILANFYFSLNRGRLPRARQGRGAPEPHEPVRPYDLKRRVFVKNPDATPPAARRPPRERSADETPRPAPLARRRLRAVRRGAELIVDLDGLVQASTTRRAGCSASGARRRAAAQRSRGLVPAGRAAVADRRVARRPAPDRPGRRLDDARRREPLSQRAGDPLVTREGELGGISVSFADITRHRALHSELEQARRELETAYEELQSTVEELETTNEELQSTNEELETTNEELQSTNEELETMNEELQSTNEELETMNDELRDRTDESLRINAFLATILGSIQQP